MTIDTIQFLYYAGFALLGWWLRHQGLLGPASPSPAPSGPLDQKALIDLLKSLLDRLTQAPAPSSPSTTGTVFHVPIEVAASARQPVKDNLS